MAILKLDFNFVKNKHNFIEIKVPIRIHIILNAWCQKK